MLSVYPCMFVYQKAAIIFFFYCLLDSNSEIVPSENYCLKTVKKANIQHCTTHTVCHDLFNFRKNSCRRSSSEEI